MIALALVLALAAPKPAPDPSAAAVVVRDRALAGEAVTWDVLTSLTTEIGPRPTGSPGMLRAKDWALATLKQLGFVNVHAESFTKENAWLRGPESASLVAPYALPLHILGLGNSAAGEVEADVACFSSYESLLAVAPGALAGKIVVVNEPMARGQNGEGYGPAVRVRWEGPGTAEKKGAVAFLTRSVATGDGRAPHTGSSAPGVKIPSAALGVADADLIARLALDPKARGPVRIKLSLQPTIVAKTEAWNISGEVPGRDPNAGTVILGGHLDSWDPGQGAHDDGAGVAVTIGAARLIAQLKEQQKPARTLRVVLYGSEESGGSSDAYLAAHKDEVPKLALATEADSGGFRAYRVLLPAGVPADPALAGLSTTLAPLRVFVARDPAEHGGADIEGLHGAGVPIAEVGVDASRYFDWHHSAEDTLDKIDRQDVEQATATWAVLMLFAADARVDFRKPPEKKEKEEK